MTRPKAPSSSRRKKVFSTGDAARLCNVSMRTVSKWFDSGRLRGYRIPGSQDRRIPREHLARFLTDNGMPLPYELSGGTHAALFVGVPLPVANAVRDHLRQWKVDTLILHASSGFEAGVVAGTELPDVVVIDLCDFSGGRAAALELADHLMGLDDLGDVSVIALVGEDEADPESLRKQHRFANVLKRPFDPQQLADLIHGGCDE